MILAVKTRKSQKEVAVNHEKFTKGRWAMVPEKESFDPRNRRGSSRGKGPGGGRGTE